MKQFKEFAEAYGRRHDAYTRDYHSSISGMGKHQSRAYHADGGANDEGWDREHHHKPADHPHSVHINGKKWKTFGSHSHATNVARKIKGATVHKEEVEIVCQDCKQQPCICDDDSHGFVKEGAESDKHYKEAEDHLSKANDADAKGDKKSFHAHMANHHDAMSEWHDSKGRSASADKHAEKAEYHHEKSLTVKEEVEQIDELSSELLDRYKKKAGMAAQAADKAKKYDIGHKRFKGIMKATFKQFANDAKK